MGRQAGRNGPVFVVAVKVGDGTAHCYHGQHCHQSHGKEASHAGGRCQDPSRVVRVIVFRDHRNPATLTTPAAAAAANAAVPAPPARPPRVWGRERSSTLGVVWLVKRERG